MKHGPSLRARLFVAIVLVAVAVLAAASAATYVLVKRSIGENALQDMRARSDSLADLGTELQRAVPLTPEDNPRLNPQERQRRIAARERARTALNLSGFNVVFIGPDGELATGDSLPNVADVVGLPRGLSPDDLDTDALVAGDEVSGTKGDTVYFAQAIGERRAYTTVVVATDDIDTSVLTDAQPWLLAAAVALVGLAALAAWLVARRLTRPIRDIERTAHALAGGDLSARAEVKRGTDQELAALAETLNAMAAQLEAARGSERAFLLSVSHDLRTPLTSIRGYAEALADGTIDGNDPESRERAAAVITAEARRLERLVRDLLDLARLDTHQFALTARTCDAAVVTRDAAAAFAPAAHDLGLTLTVDAATAIPAELDADRLAQIVANLVENAMKYARERIRVAAASDADGFAVTVTDDGPGIDETDLTRVFDRLYTVRETPGRSVGTGLGLAIVRELALAMGGTARAERPEAGGTRITVSLRRR